MGWRWCEDRDGQREKNKEKEREGAERESPVPGFSKHHTKTRPQRRTDCKGNLEGEKYVIRELMVL